MSSGFTHTGPGYDPTNLNAATASLQSFSASILGSTSSFFSVAGTNFIPYLSSSNNFTSSLIYQSGSSGGTAILINKTAGSGSALLQVYGTTYLSGAIQDSTQTLGSAGQTLVAGANGIVWILTASLASLNTFTGSGNIGTISGSGTAGYFPYMSSSTSVTASLIFQSGSNTSASILVGGTSTPLLPSNITTVMQVSGGLAAIHFLGGSKTPTIVSGSGAGTTGPNAGGFATITGSDAAGSINISTSGAPAVNAVISTITFAMVYPKAPAVILTAGSQIAATGSQFIYVTTTTSSFALNSSAALTAAKIYTWYYQVMG